jgi:hypothetical protein
MSRMKKVLKLGRWTSRCNNAKKKGWGEARIQNNTNLTEFINLFLLHNCPDNFLRK